MFFNQVLGNQVENCPSIDYSLDLEYFTISINLDIIKNVSLAQVL